MDDAWPVLFLYEFQEEGPDMGAHGEDHDHVDDDENEMDQNGDDVADDGGGHLAGLRGCDQGLALGVSAGYAQTPFGFEKVAGIVEDFGYAFVKLGPVHGETVNIPVYQQNDSGYKTGEYEAAENSGYETGNTMAFEPAGRAHEYQGQDAGEGQWHEYGAREVEDYSAEDDGEQDRAIVYPKSVHYQNR